MKRVFRTLLVLSVFTLGACGGTDSEPEGAETPAQTRADPYVGLGVIQEVRNRQLIIQHGDIPGLMGAMTMPYDVATEVDIERFAAGDEVRFELELPEPNEYVIVRIDDAAGEDIQ